MKTVKPKYTLVMKAAICNYAVVPSYLDSTNLTVVQPAIWELELAEI